MLSGNQAAKDELMMLERNYRNLLNKMQSQVVAVMESAYENRVLEKGQASKEEATKLIAKLIELRAVQSSMTNTILQQNFNEIGQVAQQQKFRNAYLEYIELYAKIYERIPIAVKQAMDKKLNSVYVDNIMAAPVQQIMRYPFMLETIMKNAIGDEHSLLSQSLEKVKAALVWINEPKSPDHESKMLDEAKFLSKDYAGIAKKAVQAFQAEGLPTRPATQHDPVSTGELRNAFNSDISGKQKLADPLRFMKFIKDQVSDVLIDEIIHKYQLDHLKGQNPQITISDVRALLVGVTTNIKAEHLSNPLTSPRLFKFLEENSKDITEMAKEQRKPLAASMDKVVLKKKNPVVGFFLRVGKAISDRAVKVNDLKDAFAGVRIHKAFEEDIKTVATFEYANTYKAGYKEPQDNRENVKKGISAAEMKDAIPHKPARQSLASGLYLASDLAYRNLNNNAIIPVLDDDGKERLYQVQNIVKDKGIVCTALIPYTASEDNTESNRALDVKIMFRGTHSVASAVIDLESTGAGSKTMRDNRIKLLDEVNAIVAKVQQQNPDRPVSLSMHGHSLGASFAERLTSEVHQAIYFQSTNGSEPTRDQQSNIRSRIKRNNQEMAGKDYTALMSLSGIKTTAANSARLSKNEAQIGDAFINMTTINQEIQHYKSAGDWVSQASYRSLGAEVTPERAQVSLLRKNAGYGGVKSMHPILGHCDHPFMQYHDKQERDIHFDYHTNSNFSDRVSLIEGLGSAKGINKQVQHTMAKLPKVLSEPVTWARKMVAKTKGNDPQSIKGFEVKTVREQMEKGPKKKH
jgi:hypothetical protein